MKWKNKNLCEFYGDTVRVERGPQIVRVNCTEENLDNKMSMPYYQVGMPDAKLNIIKKGDDRVMHIVDWRQRHAPFLWKVYQRKEGGRFEKLSEFEDKRAAIKAAISLGPTFGSIANKIKLFFGGK